MKDNDIKQFVMREFHVHSCAALHFGPWLIEPEWFRSAVSAVQSGTLVPRPQGQLKRQIVDSATSSRAAQLVVEDPSDDVPDDADYKIVGGVAVIPMEGAMMKGWSKYDGTVSTVYIRSELRKAANDPEVRAIMLVIDSPGGTLAGTEALAQDIAQANATKPVWVHIEDMGASAAYWVASQARRISATPTSLIGSLGVRMTVVDSSKAAESEGLKVYEINTGEFKSAGAAGVPITSRQLEYFQGIVNDGLAHFQDAVYRGRRGMGLDREKIAALFDGRVHDAQKAQTLGLIDSVSTLDAALGALVREAGRRADRLTTAKEMVSMATTNQQMQELCRTCITSCQQCTTDATACADGCDQMTETPDDQTKQACQDCVTACNECEDACERCSQACAKVSGMDAAQSASSLGKARTEVKAAKDRLTALIAKWETPATAAQLAEAFPGQNAFIVEQLQKGSTMAQAATAAATTFAKQLSEQAARAAVEKAELERRITAGGKVSPVVKTDPPEKPEDSAAPDPEAAAKQEWAKNDGGCRDRFIDEKTYVAARKRELTR